MKKNKKKSVKEERKLTEKKKDNKKIGGGKVGRIIKGREGKRAYRLIAIILIFLLVMIIILLLWYRGVFLGPPKGECIVLFGDVGEKKINIVFMTEDVSKKEIDNYMEFFLNSEPFLSNKEKFNFYYGGEGECDILDEKAVYCYSRELIRKSSVCPNDYIIVLSNKPKQMRSSAYMNVISLNINHDKNVILHEFGHVFANLADEYVPSIIPWGSENCQSKCEKFEKLGDLEGCFIECSESDYYRSTENSVMRSLRSSNYGKLNSELIEEGLGEYE